MALDHSTAFIDSLTLPPSTPSAAQHARCGSITGQKLHLLQWIVQRSGDGLPTSRTFLAHIFPHIATYVPACILDTQLLFPSTGLGMADPAIVELEALLSDFGLETPIPKFADADVLAKPVDIYRAYLASLLAEHLGLDACTIYEALHSPIDISLGDLAVILPRLRLNEAEVRSQFRQRVRALLP